MRWFAWCWCGCGSRSRVFDSEHRRAGALPGVEPLRRLDVRLIPQHQPAEVVDRIAQPRLNIRHHLCRTPRVVSDAADGLACAHRVRKVPALCRPKNGVKETVPPCDIASGCGCSVTLLATCVGRSFAPVVEQHVQLDGSIGIERCSGHMHAQARACDR